MQNIRGAVEMVRLQSSAVVVGLGNTGLSCVRFLLENGYAVSVVDSREVPPLRAVLEERHPGVPLYWGFDSKRLAGADLVVVSPGVSVKENAIQGAISQGVEVVGDVELFARHAAAPVIAITGSNGKSTVTALVGDMLRAAHVDVSVGGNIGVPVLDLLGPGVRVPELYVLELSSFQLETTFSLKPEAAAVLNVSPDHMDRYPDLEAYARAKGKIFTHAGVAIANRDDPATLDLVPGGTTLLTFGGSSPRDRNEFGLLERYGTLYLTWGDELLIARDQVPLIGHHNCMNVLAAMALASVGGVTKASMVAAVRRFKGLPHRSEILLHKDGIRWVNDSKATNVGATVAALNGLDSPVVLIAGGDGKRADFSELRSPIRRRARAVVLYGKDAEIIADAVRDTVPCRRVNTLREAVLAARALARAGDVVLLSPACASFDMFDNFEQRGNVFHQLLRELIA